MTSPSLPDYVKFGYAHDVDARLQQLNRSESVPFAFRLYATYKVNGELTDRELHKLIDTINPSLRAIDTVASKERIKEFYLLSPHDAYELLECIYVCEGSEGEKLEWFKIINIAGEKLTPQELRNAVYTGPWLADAKLFFSKTNCVAYKLGEPYMKGTPIRQDYLEEVLSWCAASDEISIEEYMAQHQHDQNASGLKEYFKDVIGWAKQTFPNYRKEMKGLPWGIFYNKYRQLKVDPKELEKRISALMMDDDVTKKSGVYEYVLTDDERTLNIRAFSAGQKRAAYERQQGICPFCKAEGIDKKWELSEMDADHIIPWSQGGHTVTENCQMLCKPHNRRKSAK